VTVTLVALVPTRPHATTSNSDDKSYSHNSGDGSASAATRGSHNCLDNGHVYLVANIDGHCHLALIDSGCELSLAPSTIVGDRVLRPCHRVCLLQMVLPYLCKGRPKLK